MGSLVGLLKMYDRRGLNDIDMPGSRILSSVIALISYLAPVALMVLFGCAVSQEFWLWLAIESHDRIYLQKPGVCPLRPHCFSSSVW